ncbi:MAG: 2-C-methyl-D-erythritol 4-phosphate cytidylyltransferase [Coriobacteriaceae bacterium]|nr:2-C-methyl-D-erythritol 4-phosphate cytidylyltransferase [Coriobacteriaceae bacterium]
MTVWAIIVAGGEGTRFGGAGGKQLAEVAGRPVLAQTVEAVFSCPDLEGLVVVCHPDRVEEYAESAGVVGHRLVAVAGGDTRQESVAAGLACLPRDCEMVVVHDGARPLVTPEVVSAVIAELAGHPEAAGVVVGHPSSDTVKVVDESGVVIETPDRSTLWAVQTPQAFRTRALADAHARAEREGIAGTDDASLVESAGGVVRVVLGPRLNVKVTTREDAAYVEACLADRTERTRR